MTVPHNFPALREHQFAILTAEGLTGIVLTVNGDRAIADEERYRICDSLDEARRMVRQLVMEHPLWECAIYSRDAIRIESHHNEEALMVVARRRAGTGWWSRLFGKKKV